MFPFPLGLRPAHHLASPTYTVIQEPCSRDSDLAVSLLCPIVGHFSLTFFTLKQPSLSRCGWSFALEGGCPTSPQPSSWRGSPPSLWSPGHAGPCHPWLWVVDHLTLMLKEGDLEALLDATILLRCWEQHLEASKLVNTHRTKVGPQCRHVSRTQLCSAP